MKKTYIQPTTRCMQLATEAFIAASNINMGVDHNTEIGNSEDIGAKPNIPNLWGDDEW